MIATKQVNELKMIMSLRRLVLFEFFHLLVLFQRILLVLLPLSLNLKLQRIGPVLIGLDLALIIFKGGSSLP